MEADDSWAFYIRTAEHFLQTTDCDSGEAVSAILAEADDLRKVGDGLSALIVKWESIHEPVKLPKTWSRTPADLSGLAGEYNERLSEIEEALQGDSLTLDVLGEALGTPAWRKGILQKADKAESEVSEITELLLKLFRDVPNELGRMKAGAPTPSPETSAAMVSLETAVAEITESFLKSAEAGNLSLEGLKSLLSTAGKAALGAIRAAEQALEELKAAKDQQRQKKDEEKPAKKTTKKAAAKSQGVKLQAPAAPSTWFYLNEANEAQQSDLRVLADLIKDGALTRQSHVWREGWAEWREIGQVEELAKLFDDLQLPLVPSLTSIFEKLVPFMPWYNCYLNCDIGHYPPKPEFKKKSIGASSYIKKSVTISGAKPQPSDEEIFFIWDHTWFGSAENGMSLSKCGIFWFAGHGQKKPWFYPFSSIRNVYSENGLIVFKFADGSTHQWQVIVAAVLDCHLSKFVEGLADLAKYHEYVFAYAMRAVSDPVTDELIAALSNNQSFSLDALRAVVYKRLKALNADIDVEAVIHLRTYEKLLNLVNRGLVEKKGNKYRKYRD
jgi:hypothetical protein